MMRAFAGHTAEVNGCAFSPDGRYALSASGNLFGECDCTVRLWDLTNMAMPQSYTGHTAEVNGCAFSPDGQYALSASSDGTLRLWDVASGKTIRIFQGHTGKVAGCAFSPDGQQALSIGNEMRLWDMAKGKTIYTFREAYSSGGDGCTFSPDGQKALSISGYGGALDLWDVATGAMTHRFEIRPLGIGTYVVAVKSVSGGAFSPDGRQVVYGSQDGTLRLFDTASGEEIRVFDNGHYGYRKRCVFRPNGQQVLSAGRDLLLWDVTSGAVARSFEGHSDWVNSCTFSPDGRYVLSASNDCTLRLWNMASGREQARWTTDARLLCCAFGPDNETVIAGDNMGGLHFLSIVT